MVFLAKTKCYNCEKERGRLNNTYLLVTTSLQISEEGRREEGGREEGGRREGGGREGNFSSIHHPIVHDGLLLQNRLNVFTCSNLTDRIASLWDNHKAVSEKYAPFWRP